MKSVSAILALFFLFSCGDTDAPASSGSDTEGSAIENFDCTKFFDKGDYSSACFTEDLPEITEEILTDGLCSYDVGKQAGFDYGLLSVDFSTSTLPVAKGAYDILRKDAEDMVSDISDIGDEAYIEESENDKRLSVRYKNILITFYIDNSSPSCIFERSELESFARLVVENID